MKENNLDKSIDWKKLNTYVKESLKSEKTGHDYQHTKRVLKLAIDIADNSIGVDYDVLVASCLLHDIANRNGVINEHHVVGSEEAETITRLLKFEEEKIKKIKNTILDYATRNETSLENGLQLSMESKILRDAHDIDNIGSIGLIKVISRSLKKETPIFQSKDDILGNSIYGNIKFLLTFPEKMLTQYGKKIALERVAILVEFLKELEKEY
jgi:uncharacterized protein